MQLGRVRRWSSARENARDDVMTKVLGLLFVAGAVLGAVSFALPHPKVRSPAEIEIVEAGTVAIGAILLRAGRVRILLVNTALAAASLLVAAAFNLSGVASGIYSAMFVWIVLFAAYFLRPRAAFAHLGWLLLCYGVALTNVRGGAAGYSAVTRWLFIAVALAVVTTMTSWLVQRGRTAEERTRRFFELSDDMLCTAAEDGHFVELNPAWTRVLGWSAEELCAHPFLEWVHPDDRERTIAETERAFADSGAAKFENRYFAKDGSWHWLSWSSAFSPDTGLVYARATDVTERKRLEAERERLVKELGSLARTDALTGVPNRRWLDDELRRELARSARQGSDLCIAMVDLDHFKRFNDKHGHPEGDRVLRAAAAAWRDALRASDFLARYGGEEFTVLLPDCAVDHAREVMERLRAVTPAGLTCSVGVAEWRPGEGSDALLARADAALYEAKRAGRGRTVVAGGSDAVQTPPVAT